MTSRIAVFAPIVPFAALALSAASAHALPATDPWDPPPTQFTPELCADKIDGATTPALGAPTSGVRVESSGFCWRSFQKGRIHTGTLASSHTVVITGSVLGAFASHGYEHGSLGQALYELTDAAGVRIVQFAHGQVVVHASLGTHTLVDELSGLWTANQTDHQRGTRFGYPTGEEAPNAFGSGSAQMLEHGYIAKIGTLGSWIDYTGDGEGKVSAAIDLYSDANLAGTKLTRTLTGDNPLAQRAQFGALDNLTSSLTLEMPSRTSLYVYEDSPLDGRYVRITGADNATVRVSNIGTFLNDRASSMVLVNHGTASMLIPLSAPAGAQLPGLAQSIRSGLDGLDTQKLMHDALASRDGSGTLTWHDDLRVSMLPGERAIHFERSADFTINAVCSMDLVRCNLWGTVTFSVSVRPSLVTIPATGSDSFDGKRETVHVRATEATATSTACNDDVWGKACDSLDAMLATMFDNASTLARVTAPFDAGFDLATQAVKSLPQECAADHAGHAGIERVNVLPTGIEIVLSDEASVATWVKGSFYDGLVGTSRPQGVATNGDTHPHSFLDPVPPFDGTVKVVPNLALDPPPLVH